MAIYIAPTLNDCIVDYELVVYLPEDTELVDGLVLLMNTGAFSASRMEGVGSLCFMLGDVRYQPFNAEGGWVESADLAKNTVYEFVFDGETFVLVTSVTTDDIDSLKESIEGLDDRVSTLERTSGSSSGDSGGLTFDTQGSGVDANSVFSSSRMFIPSGSGSNFPIESPCFLETGSNTDADYLIQAVWPASHEAEMEEWRRIGAGKNRLSGFVKELGVLVYTMPEEPDDEDEPAPDPVELYASSMSMSVYENDSDVFVGSFDDDVEHVNCVTSQDYDKVYATLTFEGVDLGDEDETSVVIGDSQVATLSGETVTPSGLYIDDVCQVAVLEGSFENGALTLSVEIVALRTYTGSAEWGEWHKIGGDSGDSEGSGDSDELNEIKLEVTNHEYRIGVLEDDNRTTASTLSTINSTLEEHDTRISRAQTEANDIASDLSKAQYDIDALQTKVDGLEVGDTDLSSELGELKEKIEGFDDRIAAAETTVAEAAAKVNSYDQVISDVAVEVSEFGERITEAEGKVETCETSVEELSGKFDTLDAHVVELEGSVETLQASVDTFEPRLQACEDGTAKALETTETFDTRLATVEEELTTDSASWKNLSQAFVRLDADVISVTDRTDALEEQMADVVNTRDIPLFFEGDSLPSTLDYAVESGFSVRAYIPQGLTHVEFVDALVNTYAGDSAVVRVTHLFEKAESSVVDSLSCGEKSVGVSNRVRESGRSLVKIYLACPDAPSKFDESGEKASAFAYLRLYFG